MINFNTDSWDSTLETFPFKGQMVHISGTENTGKTTLCLETAAQICAAGGRVCFLDFNLDFSPEYIKSLGISLEDSSRFQWFQPENLDEGIDIICDKIRSKFDLIIIDSLAAAKSILEKGDGRATTKKWADSLPALKMALPKYGTCLMGVSHLRSERSLKSGVNHFWIFYSSLSLLLSKEFNKASNSFDFPGVGQQVKMEIFKSKGSPAMGESTFFYLRSGEGVDEITSLIEIALSQGLIQQQKCWFIWKEENIQCLGFESFRTKIKNSPELTETLKAKVGQKRASSVEDTQNAF